MKRCLLPVWLLRDFAAFFAVLLGFWPLTILLIAMGGAAVRGTQNSETSWRKLYRRLALAETTLDWAIMREAYRLIGWKASHAQPRAIPPPRSPHEALARLTAYRAAFADMHARARACAKQLCTRHRVQLVARSAGYTMRRPLSSSDATRRWGQRIALTHARACAHDGLPRRSAAKAGGGSRRRLRIAAPRAPPRIPQLPIANCLARASARERPRAPLRSPP